MLKYTGKILFGNKSDMFFKIFFPLAYAVIFLLAMQGLLNDNTEFEAIPVALEIQADSQDEKEQVMQALDTLGVEAELVEGKLQEVSSSENNKKEDDKSAVFVKYLQVSGEDEVAKLMKDGLLNNFIRIKAKDKKIFVDLKVDSLTAENLSNSIVYSIFNSFTQIYNAVVGGSEDYIVSSLQSGKNLETAMDEFSEKISTRLNREVDYIKSMDEDKNINSMTGFFYAVLAYVCIYFMASGFSVIQLSEADQSIPARVEILSPTSKKTFILIRFAMVAALSIIMTFVTVFIFHLAGVPLGNNYPALLFLIALGVVVALLLGMLVAVIDPTKGGKESAFANILTIGFPLLCAFFSGMMGTGPGQMMNKYPLIAKYNPVGLISSGMYYITEYPSLEQYWNNVRILGMYALVSLIIVIVLSRRSDYEYL